MFEHAAVKKMWKIHFKEKAAFLDCLWNLMCQPKYWFQTSIDTWGSSTKPEAVATGCVGLTGFRSSEWVNFDISLIFFHLPRLLWPSRLCGRFFFDRWELLLFPLRLSDSRAVFWKGKVSGSWSTLTIWSFLKWPTGSVPSDSLSSFLRAAFIFCSITERPPRSLPMVDFQIEGPLK